jgi:uncharacterized protein (DUF1810 family)
MKMEKPNYLERFVSAQNADGRYERARGELRRGYKSSHWMWFVFPQIAGLGHSAMSRMYGIASLEEAKEYRRHPVLGPRLMECAAIVSATRDRTAEDIFGRVDAQKLRSSMTLFMRVAPHEPLFGQVLERFFGGLPDVATDRMLRGRRPKGIPGREIGYTPLD